MEEVNRLLELLYDRGERWYAPHELAAAGAVAPGRLERVLELLRHRGHSLETDPAHGIRLVGPMRLDAHLIERNLGARRVGRHVICFDEIESTNDVAFDSARQADSDGLVVLAESQRSGRGRLGRKWISPARANVLLSVLLVDSGNGLSHEAMTVAAGLAVAEAVETPDMAQPQVYWPNDVLVDGRKLAGILVEMKTVGSARAMVIGIGLNANAAPTDERVDRPATCLAEQLGCSIDRIEVVRAVLGRLDEWVARVAAGKTDLLREAWRSRCGMLNQRVTIVRNRVTYVGRALDINPLEGLVLVTDAGKRVHLPAAGSTVIHR